ncbi:MAG: alanine racemase [Campylobacterota bacterium]|nr:alanine racemase [Campylobacterota bacterium]
MAYITLSRKAFFHNLDIISAHVSDLRKIALVMKDNAYGHGLIEIATLAQEYGVTKAVVRHESEAQRIADFFEYILILDDIPHTPLANFVYTVNNMEQITSFKRGSRVELKVDTGMHRNGVGTDEVDAALEAIERQGLTCKGIFTHFRSADTLSSELFWQKKQFETIKNGYANRGYQFHSANSAGTFRTLTCKEDMVRVGIAAYGCLELDEVYAQPDLKPILSLVAERQTTRLLKASQGVGYNAICKVKEDTIVSTYDIGYADGFLRSASNRYITPNGSKLLGRISMDNTSFTCKDEELVLFDNANTLAKAAGTIGYEVLTRLSSSLERRLIP